MAKQLSLPERIIIEKMIHQDYSFATIGRHLNRSASTISREVLNYRKRNIASTLTFLGGCFRSHRNL